jgi:hypothetical protein
VGTDDGVAISVILALCRSILAAIAAEHGQRERKFIDATFETSYTRNLSNSPPSNESNKMLILTSLHALKIKFYS